MNTDNPTYSASILLPLKPHNTPENCRRNMRIYHVAQYYTRCLVPTSSDAWVLPEYPAGLAPYGAIAMSMHNIPVAHCTAIICHAAIQSLAFDMACHHAEIAFCFFEHTPQGLRLCSVNDVPRPSGDGPYPDPAALAHRKQAPKLFEDDPGETCTEVLRCHAYMPDSMQKMSDEEYEHIFHSALASH